MEEPHQKNSVMCRFPVINLVMAGGGDGLLPPPHPARGEFQNKNLNFSLTEDPYQNNDVTFGMPVTDFVRGGGTVSRSLTCIHGALWGIFYPLQLQCILTIGYC